VYFFDTNMIVSNSRSDLRVLKLFTLNKSYFIDDHLAEEIRLLKEKEGFRTILESKLQVMTFDDLRRKSPEICPLYYNFITAMHNPAIVWGQNFFAENTLAELMKGDWSSAEEKQKYEKAHGKIMNHLHEQVELKKKNKYRNEKLYDFIQSANFKSLKKKREAIKKNDPNYFNDLRCMSLALIYCLINKKNVTFVTADVDHINLLSNLTETLSQQQAFVYFTLSQLGEEGKKRLLKGDKTTLSLPTFDFIKMREELEGDMYDASWKKDSFCFKVKFWDQDRQKYRSFSLGFNKNQHEMFLTLSGQLCCPYAQNNSHGNWICFKYWWPPRAPDDLFNLKVEVGTKSIINKRNRYVENEYHNAVCKYVLQDKINDVRSFSQFSIEKID